MTHTHDNGGPAVQIVQEGAYSPEVDGMSLRQWYAGQAMANPTICTGNAPEILMRKWFGDRMNICRAEIVAMQAITYADAMVAAVGEDA